MGIPSVNFLLLLVFEIFCSHTHHSLKIFFRFRTPENMYFRCNLNFENLTRSQYFLLLGSRKRKLKKNSNGICHVAVASCVGYFFLFKN
uniref:Secreted protein n=1 Tax=Panstrongylus lignarius TaxID=156445 RepID=A0A224XRV8_9HEMI